MLFDLLATFIILSAFIAYHTYFLCHIFDREDTKKHTVVGINLQNAKLWVFKHISEADNNASVLLAVHTLRNTILVGIFVGGSSFTFLLQTLGSSASLQLESSNQMMFIRSIILGSFFSLSFLCWTTVIRCAGRCSLTLYHYYYIYISLLSL